ncbi:MAG: PIN domain-containing protein [Deltaproteobacteria bacterium]|nr:PIN domain-containing protein [Deltaproteobacteria bacterium]
MIAFFDTSVHVALLRGSLATDVVLDRVSGGPVRLSPVVASELLRGAVGPAARAVERLVATLVPIEPPSWRRCWLEAGRLLPVVFPDHEPVGLARLQNDMLLALTARHTGAVLVAHDDHFATLGRHVPFRLLALT